ncbi:hypothetical protein [Pseudomonas reidholzensis]|uniref:hypothetical protein n=1 Tax=Pseudomonas reidholzensis TaxID=1785162 RepID=UPI0011C41EC2|nr:hypothetical protein [Pseudomonas reidholzensis]
MESSLIDPKGKVIQQALMDLARTAITLKRAGHRVVVAVGEPPNARGDYPGDQVYRAGYASMVVSQTKLMSEWKNCFDSCSELAAQVLVDAVIFHNKHRAQQLADVLTELTDMGVIPIVGLSAAGRGVGSSLLDTFLLGLLDKPPVTARAKAAV